MCVTLQSNEYSLLQSLYNVVTMIECLIYSWPTSRYLVIDYLLIGIFFLIVRVSL